MRPENLQNICNLLILIGLIFTALGGYGTYHFGKKVEQKNDSLIVELNQKIQEQANDIIGYSKGEENPKAYLMPMTMSPLVLTLNLQNDSKYPVFDIKGYWIDLDEPIDPERGKLWTYHQFQLENLYSNKIMLNIFSFDFSKREKLRINVFMSFRSGSLTSQFRVVKVGNTLRIAFQNRYGQTTENHIPEDFPGYEKDNPDLIFQ